MRGHWLSQTRKLNKHYQSAPKQEEDDYGIFFTASCLTQRYVAHTDSPGVYDDHNVFYNEIQGNYANYSFYELAFGTRNIGYRYNKDYDGAFLPAGRQNLRHNDEIWRLGGGGEWSVLRYANDILITGTGEKGPVLRMPECYNEGDRELQLTTWGFEFARYHVPKYGCGPAKFYDTYQSSCNFDINKPYLPALLSIPDYNGIELTAKATFDAAHKNSMHYQIISIMGGGYTSLTLLNGTSGVLSDPFNDLNFSVWEDLECNGLSYYDNGNSYSFSNADDGIIRTCRVRVYVFFQDGDLWISIRPRIIDDSTGEDVTEHYQVYLKSCHFPNTPSGYLHRDAFPANGATYYTGNVVGGVCTEFPLARTGSVYARGYGLTNRYGYEVDPWMRVYKLTEKKFWDMEQAFHDRVGGTSYYEEFSSQDIAPGL